MTALNIQTVSGLIRKAPGITASHKYKKLSPLAGRSIRSVGIYAFKDYHGQIIVGFNHEGYAHQIDVAGEQLKKFQDFAISKGFQFETLQGRRFELNITRAA
jgi:hypothetical protein